MQNINYIFFPCSHSCQGKHAQRTENVFKYKHYYIQQIFVVFHVSGHMKRQTRFLPSGSFLGWPNLPKPLLVGGDKAACSNIPRIVCLCFIWFGVEDVIFTNTYIWKVVPVNRLFLGCRHVGLLYCLMSVVRILTSWLTPSHRCVITSGALERASHLQHATTTSFFL